LSIWLEYVRDTTAAAIEACISSTNAQNDANASGANIAGTSLARPEAAASKPGYILLGHI